MYFPKPQITLGICCALVALLSSSADAQIVRRYAGGGVQVNAPFVRVNVGRGGTAVRAPYTSINTPGAVAVGRPFLRGRRRRAAAAQQQAAQQQAAYQRQQQAAAQTSAQPARQPTRPATPSVAQSPSLDELPYPTPSQLTSMDDQALVETLRDMMSRLDQRLALLKTGDGWRRHLVLSVDVLGEPGNPADVLQMAMVQKYMMRYQRVVDEPGFTKISNLPSFVATHAALQEAVIRFAASDVTEPALGNPNEFQTAPATTQPANSAVETDILPTPAPAEIPNATRGERSILKRK